MVIIKAKNIPTIVFLVVTITLSFSIIIHSAKPVGSYIIKHLILNQEYRHNNLKTIVKNIEQIFNDNVPIKLYAAEVYTGFQMLFDKRIIDEGEKGLCVYKMNNGKITFASSLIDIDPIAANIINFKNFLESKKIPLIYVQAPFKVNKFNNELPYGSPDNVNENANNLITKLKNNSIQVLDLRDIFNEWYLNYDDAFYNTDHHWTPEAALFGLRKTLEFINHSKYGIIRNISKLDNSKFKYVTLKQSFLGSEGKRVGKVLAGIDDFTYLVPKDNHLLTCITFDKNLTENVRVEGAFEDAIMNKKFLLDEDITSSRYSVYFGDNYPCQEIINETGEGNILIIKDSFGLPYCAFASLVYKKVVTCDLRALNKGKLNEIVNNNIFDLVLILYNPKMINDKVMLEPMILSQ